MSHAWKHPDYNAELSAQIKADIESTNAPTLNDKIKEAMTAGSPWKVAKLKAMAQREFNLMVQSNGELTSQFADVREVYKRYIAHASVSSQIK